MECLLLGMLLTFTLQHYVGQLGLLRRVIEFIDTHNSINGVLSLGVLVFVLCVSLLSTPSLAVGNQ